MSLAGGQCGKLCLSTGVAGCWVGGMESFEEHSVVGTQDSYCSFTITSDLCVFITTRRRIYGSVSLLPELTTHFLLDVVRFLKKDEI